MDYIVNPINIVCYNFLKFKHYHIVQYHMLSMHCIILFCSYMRTRTYTQHKIDTTFLYQKITLIFFYWLSF